MLRIYEVSLSVIRKSQTVVDAIARHDPDLAKQMRRASSSVTLNIAEGSSSQGRNRKARYFNALGSAKEVRACMHVALAAGYIKSIDNAHADRVGVRQQRARHRNPRQAHRVSPSTRISVLTTRSGRSRIFLSTAT